MAETAAYLDRQHAKVTDALLALGYRPEQGIEHGSKDMRARAERLLGKWGRMNELRQSCKKQREENREPMDDMNFAFLSDIDIEQRDKVFNGLPDCMFKRFQVRFCKPEEYIVPRPAVDGINISFPGVDANGFDALTLRCCIVNPEEIPKELLEDLHICDFEDERGDRIAQIEKKYTMIPALKEKFESAQRLEKGNGRMYVLQNGTLLYFRESGAVVQHFENAHDALRKTSHATVGYAKERKQLAQILTEVAAGKRELDQLRQYDLETRLQVEARVRTMLAENAQRLERCINPQKMEAHSMIAAASSLKDKRGRSNVSASMARVTGSENRIHSRKREMRPKGRFNGEDAHVLIEKISEQEAVLQIFEEAMHVCAKKFERIPSLGKTKMKMDGLRAQTGLRREYLDTVTLEPMRAYAQKYIDKDVTLEEAVTSGHRQKIIETIIEMHVIAKFHRVRNTIERINTSVIDPQNQSVGALRQAMTELRAVFDEKQMFPDVTVEGYVEPFQTLQDALRKIERKLKQYEEHPDELYPDMFEKLKNYLATLAPETIIRNLA